MSPLALSFVATAVCLAVLFATETGAPRVSLAAKTAASCVFVYLAWTTGAVQDDVGRWVLAALIFGLIGDVGLGLGKLGFKIGLGAFFLGHALLLVALLLRASPSLMPAAACALAILPALVWMKGKLQRHAGKLAIPALMYMVLISVALVVAWGQLSVGLWVPVGLSLFWVSDVFVARRRFWAPGPWNRRLGLPLYYAAQLLIATFVRGL